MVYPPSWPFRQSVWGHITTLHFWTVELSWVWISWALKASSDPQRFNARWTMEQPQWFNTFSAASENGCLVFFWFTLTIPWSIVFNASLVLNLFKSNQQSLKIRVCSSSKIVLLLTSLASVILEAHDLRSQHQLLAVARFLATRMILQATWPIITHWVRYQIQVSAYF